MRTQLLLSTILLLATAPFASAQLTPAINNAQLITVEERDPRQYQVSDGHWLAYAVTTASAPSLCCYQRPRNGSLRTGCALGSESSIYGSSDQLPASTQLVIYAQQEAGHITRLLTVSGNCPVDAGQRELHWLNEVGQAQSITWLAQLAQQSKIDHLAESAIWALGRHDAAAAGEQLEQLAQQMPEALADTAVYSISAISTPERLQRLENLLQRLPSGRVRQSISYALSNHNSEGAWEALRQLALNDTDPRQRNNSIHLLGQSSTAENLSALQNLLDRNEPIAVQEAAVHALGESGTKQAIALLLRVARSNHSHQVTGIAWYILARAAPQLARNELDQYLLEPHHETIVHLAIAGVAEGPKGIASLVRFTAARYPSIVRRSALVHLAESDNPLALSALTTALE